MHAGWLAGWLPGCLAAWGLPPTRHHCLSLPPPGTLHSVAHNESLHPAKIRSRAPPCPTQQAVDILLANAGLALGVSSVQELDLDDVKTMMDTNVVSVAALVRAFTPGMVSRNSGHLIFMSSIAGHEAYAGGAAYCATKHALDAFATSGEGVWGCWELVGATGACWGCWGLLSSGGWSSAAAAAASESDLCVVCHDAASHQPHDNPCLSCPASPACLPCLPACSAARPGCPRHSGDLHQPWGSQNRVQVGGPLLLCGPAGRRAGGSAVPGASLALPLLLLLPPPLARPPLGTHRHAHLTCTHPPIPCCSVVRFKGDEGKADAVYEGIHPLLAADIADNVLYAVTRPPHVQIAEILVFATYQCSAKGLARVAKS